MMVKGDDGLMQYFSNRGSEKYQFYEMLIGILKKEFHVPVNLRNTQESLIC